MFIDLQTIRTVKGLSEEELMPCNLYIEKSVYAWLNEYGDKIFTVRDLFGGKNSDWRGCPLQVLWNKQKRLGKNDVQAYKQAARDLGWLLKGVLDKDAKHKFSIVKYGLVNGYSGVLS